jgi:hypothetical protein
MVINERWSRLGLICHRADECRTEKPLISPRPEHYGLPAQCADIDHLPCTVLKRRVGLRTGRWEIIPLVGRSCFEELSAADRVEEEPTPGN